MIAADHLLDLAWFDSSHAFLATATIGDDDQVASVERLRPLSLGSMLALKVMGLTVFDVAHQLTSEQEQHEIALYKWLHLDDLDRVKRLVFSGMWKELSPGFGPPSLEIIAAFRAFRDQTLATLAAASVIVAPKPSRVRSTGERPPSTVVAPSLLTWRVEFLAAKTNLDREFIRWQLPVSQALQMIHHHLWYDGSWTVRPSADAPAVATDAEPFTKFELFAMEPPPPDDAGAIDTPSPS